MTPRKRDAIILDSWTYFWGIADAGYIAEVLSYLQSCKKDRLSNNHFALKMETWSRKRRLYEHLILNSDRNNNQGSNKK
jgi:hypothetical protein